MPSCARILAASQAAARCSRRFGIAGATAPTILAELGDVSRLRRSRQAVRLAGSSGDRRRSLRSQKPRGQAHQAGLPGACAGLCMRPPSRRAGQRAPTTPSTWSIKERGLSHTRASLTISRKLARRCYHTLREHRPRGASGGHVEATRISGFPRRRRRPPGSCSEPCMCCLVVVVEVSTPVSVLVVSVVVLSMSTALPAARSLSLSTLHWPGHKTSVDVVVEEGGPRIGAKRRGGDPLPRGQCSEPILDSERAAGWSSPVRGPPQTTTLGASDCLHQTTTPSDPPPKPTHSQMNHLPA